MMLWHNRSGLWWFAGGVVIMVVSVVTGQLIDEEIATAGMDAYTASNGAEGWLKFVSFAFGFPAGLGIAAIGIGSASGLSRRALALFCVFVLGALSAGVLVPVAFGRSLSGMFFGAGGYTIWVLVVALVWLWGRNRARLSRSARVAADLQGAGYLCFAMAAWNLCGVGGMPSFALTPDRMLTLGGERFAIGQMKAIMVLLVFGWLLTVIGYRKMLQDKLHQAKEEALDGTRYEV